MLIKRIDGSASQLGAPAGAEAKYPDDLAVDQFAEAMKAKLADARAKDRSGWQECDPTELSYMLREHVDKGDPRDVANFCMFLWSLGKPIGDARPVVDLQLTPLDGILVWIDAYTNAANGPHFMGHGRIVQLLREYLALRKLLAQSTPPPLPETHYNGCGDGSEPLYTADMVRLYAMQYAAPLALPAGPMPAIPRRPESDIASVSDEGMSLEEALRCAREYEERNVVNTSFVVARTLRKAFLSSPAGPASEEKQATGLPKLVVDAIRNTAAAKEKCTAKLVWSGLSFRTESCKTKRPLIDAGGNSDGTCDDYVCPDCNQLVRFCHGD